MKTLYIYTMKTVKLYAPLIATLLVLVATYFIPFWWLRIVIFVLIALVWFVQIAIYMLRHKSGKLKKWFPKYTWHIQRLHEQYILESFIVKPSATKLKKLEQEYQNYLSLTKEPRQYGSFHQWVADYVNEQSKIAK